MVGQPLTMDVQVSDSCGNLVMPVGGGDAAVKAVFSNNDGVLMTHIGNGIWQGTWRPVSPGSLTLVVDPTSGPVTNIVGGSTVLTVVVSAPAPAAATPIVTAQGVVQAASDQGGVPIAPGG